MKANWDLLKDAGLLGNVLENKGVPRWALIPKSLVRLVPSFYYPRYFKLTIF